MDVSIVGLGMIPVREHWARGLRELAAEAGAQALEDAGLARVDALFIGNAYAATYNQQTQLGSLIADEMGLSGIEAMTCEAGDASGGAALRAGCLAIASGLIASALVIGVEKATDIVGEARIRARGISLDSEMEALQGATLTAMAALLMRRYMWKHGLDLADFEGFSVNAHRNGALNPHAMFRNALRRGAFARAPMLADPVSLFDCAPDGDGAAALVLTNAETAADLVPRPLQICASSVATDRFAVADRANPLRLDAVAASFSRALTQAGIEREAIDLLEIHDAYTILTTLALEAMGYRDAGTGWTLAKEAGKAIALDGEIPLSTFGGLKSRGHPGGATGLYQAVEAALQLRRQAGANQVAGARTALIQCLGGLGSTAISHILRATPD